MPKAAVSTSARPLSAVAVLEAGELEVIPNAEGARSTPSVVGFTKSDELMVGEAAKRQAATKLDRTVGSVLRHLGTHRAPARTRPGPASQSQGTVVIDRAVGDRHLCVTTEKIIFGNNVIHLDTVDGVAYRSLKTIVNGVTTNMERLFTVSSHGKIVTINLNASGWKGPTAREADETTWRTLIGFSNQMIEPPGRRHGEPPANRHASTDRRLHHPVVGPDADRGEGEGVVSDVGPLCRGDTQTRGHRGQRQETVRSQGQDLGQHRSDLNQRRPAAPGSEGCVETLRDLRHHFRPRVRHLPEPNKASSPRPCPGRLHLPTQSTNRRTMGAQTPAAGWYPDPTGNFYLRWWDGDEWTDLASSRLTTVTDPLSDDGTVDRSTYRVDTSGHGDTTSTRHPYPGREWQQAGLTPKEAAPWWSAGFDVEWALPWVEAGWEASVAKSYVLLGFEVEEAALWHDSGVAAPTAAEWMASEFNAAAVTGWLALSLEPVAAKQWRDGGWIPAKAAAWVSAGISASDAALWRRAGLAPTEAQEWGSYHFDPTEAGRWRQLGIGAERAQAWRSRSFSVDETDWVTSALPPDHARAWRAAGFSVSDAATLTISDAVDRVSVRVAAGLLFGLGAAGILTARAVGALTRLASADLAVDGAADLLTSLAEAGVDTRGVAAMVEAVTGTSMAFLDASAIAASGLSTFDDLLDSGVRSPAFLAEVADHVNEEDARYVRARLDSGALSEEELRALGHTAELARRAVLSADAATLALLPDSPEVCRAREVVNVLRGDRAMWRTDNTHGLMKIAGAEQCRVEDLEVLASDPTTWPVVATAVVALLTSHPHLQVSPIATWVAEWCSMSVARESLRNWRWTSGRQSAGVWLDYATSCSSRAGAFTAMGVCAWQLGDAVEARRCFTGAVVEHPTAPLHVNLSIVELEHNPTEAARQLALASLALPDREAGSAGVKAIEIWARGAGSEGPPRELAMAARRLAVLEITLDQQVSVLHFLRAHDEEWLAVKQNTVASPHSGTAEHGVRIAEATGLPEYLKALGSAAADGIGPRWAIRECDSLVAQAVEVMHGSGDRRPLSWAVLTLDLVDNGIVLDDRAAILLTDAAVGTILDHSEQSTDDPSHRLLQRLQAVEHRLPGIEGSERSRLQEMLEVRSDQYIFVRLAFRKAVCARIAATLDILADRIRQDTGVGVTQSFRLDSDNLVSSIETIIDDLDRFQDLARSAELGDRIGEVRLTALLLRDRLHRLRLPS